jgi:Co/Zn/Cd efflux system component
MEVMRKVLRLVAILNLAYFFIEFTFAIQLESVSLLADSIDFLEDASINILVFIGLSWTLSSRKVLARILALFLMIPVILMIPSIVREINDSNPPSGIGITFVAAGALIINFSCSLMLVRYRKNEQNLVWAAYLSARNDAIANICVIAVGVLTIFWPISAFDIAAGIGIGLLNSTSAIKVWRSAGRYSEESS